MAKIRANLLISGKVQGVFYRASAQAEGQKLGLTGWVKNLASGEVEAEVEGEEEAVDQFCAWCRRGPPHAVVDEVRVRRLPYTGEHRTFVVAR